MSLPPSRLAPTLALLLLACLPLTACAQSGPVPTAPVSTAPAPSATADEPLYRQAGAPIDDRVEDLLARMTVEEKVGQMTQLTLQAVTRTQGETVAGPTAQLGGAAGDAAFNEWDLDPDKLRNALVTHHLGSMLNVGSHGYDVPTWRGIIREVQRVATQETRLGIPILYGVDAVHGANYIQGATLFPQNLALAATFNRDLARLSGAITARETGATGVPWNFAPVLDTGRQPMWGRFYETFGEDVYITGELGAALIRGYQEGMDGADLDDWNAVAATGKHFVGYSGPEGGKDRTTAIIPERMLRELYLPPFQAAMEAGVRTIMVNSGDVNGEPVHASRYLLTDVLRGELGFDGVLVTDWEDVIKLHTVHRVAEDERAATKLSVEAGIDLSMVPLRLSFYDHLLDLVRSGEIAEARLDQSVRRLLRLKFELGLFETPYPPDVDPAAVIRTADAQQANLEAARQSIVLLQNDGVLPLSADQRVLVTGPTATSLVPLNGGWTYTWQGTDDAYAAFYPDVPTLLGAIEGQAASVTYVPGATLDAAVDLDAVGAAAQDADVIVVALGEGAYAEKPGDIDRLELPDAQQDLLEAALASGKPVVAVMIQGRPRLAGGLAGADAVVTALLPGNMGGQALADVLFGQVNPSGRLPFSYPRFTGTLLPYDHSASSMTGAQYAGEGRTGGYDPLYPFGHGLSYTTFAYSDLTLSAAQVRPGEMLRASVTVENTGSRPGDDAVLAFTRDLYASLVPAARKLRGFERVSLAPGERATVSFDIPVDDLAFASLRGEPVLEAGTFEVHVGDQVAAFELVAD